MARRAAERELTAEQEAALTRLIDGATVAETAEAAGVPLASVRAWLASDPLFVAEANRLRRATWDNQADRLRALAPQAVDALLACLHDEDPRTRLRAAFAILRAVGLDGRDDNLKPRGATTAAGVQSDWMLGY